MISPFFSDSLTTDLLLSARYLWCVAASTLPASWLVISDDRSRACESATSRAASCRSQRSLHADCCSWRRDVGLGAWARNEAAVLLRTSAVKLRSKKRRLVFVSMCL